MQNGHIITHLSATIEDNKRNIILFTVVIWELKYNNIREQSENTFIKSNTIAWSLVWMWLVTMYNLYPRVTDEVSVI